MDAFETVCVELRDGVGWITLNRPHKANCFSVQMRDDLHALLSALRLDDELRVIVLAGAGERGFCGGADLSEFLTAPSSLGARRIRQLRDLWSLLREMPQPTIAALHGYVFGSGVAQEYHMRWFEAHLPADGSVTVTPLGLSMVGLSIAGPKAREVLAKVVDEDVSDDAFRFMDFRETHLGLAPVKIGRITFTGDLGYEIWMAPEYQVHVYDRLMEAGAEFGIGLFGGRALNALRLEKNFGTWAREFRPIYGPYEAGLGRFVALSKNDFIGRDAAVAQKEKGPERKLVSMVVDAGEADVIGDEPVWHDGKVVGWVTSGGYAHASRSSVALGYIPAALADADGFEIEILGDMRKARLQPAPLFDPEGKAMRG